MQPTHSHPLSIPLLVLAVVPAIAIIAWPVSLFMSVFIFDAPGSDKNIANWVIVFIMLTYPVPSYVGFKMAKHGHEIADLKVCFTGCLLAYSLVPIFYLASLFSPFFS
ncbi:hypothetical protein QWY77_08230 [Thalassotalea ponticola]|uniref:hypothetical protein n=1 Tax=Thalassotalea ponticola TaxID=1523392 RepID=UPI0025B4B7DB|nr:hypothetical protein [Thalassotalea ponticola]MDN3652751.1 hypothetical protein [Thalassotalea ponticola]